MAELDKTQAQILEQYRIQNPLGINSGKARVSSQYNLFSRDYFSGSDVYICFNNLPMEEIFELKYSMTQQTQGIFGYGSYTWDAVAYGNRFIEGSFKINFKEAFYLRSVLEKLQRGATLSTQTAQKSYSETMASADLTLDELMVQLKSASGSEIKALANAYENRLWNSDQTINKREQTAWADVYGGYDYQKADGSWNSVYNPILKVGFDIVVAFGDKIYEMNKRPSDQTTAKVINDVHLTGFRTIYEPSGEPISEEYSFIARDMDDSLTLSGRV